MKSRNFILRATRHALHTMLFALTILLIQTAPLYAGMTSYCAVPPFIAGGIPPNLLLMIDNSASQYDLAYIAGSTTATTTFTCNGGLTTQTSFCYDNTYSNTYQYVGYFDPASIYWYNIYPATDSTGATFPVSPSSDIFTVVSSMPGSCTYGGSSSTTPYVCINKSGSNATAFYATGNYLNWLSASKFDQQKQVLTGGKYDTTYSLLGGESRGCVGGRFIKADTNPLHNLSNITFAVRGPIEPDVITNTYARGGMTRIEIYFGSISSNTMQSCQCAIAEWTSGTSYGQAQTDTKACLSLANNEINAFNQILQDCWKIKQNIAGGATVCGTGNGEIFKGVSINSDETQCGNVYNDVCGSNGNLNGSNQCTSSSTAPGNWIANQGLTISSTGGAWQCTNQAAHLPPTSPYNACDSGTAEDPTDTQGFLGRCSDFEVSHGKLSVNWDDNCVYKEILHYCFGTQVAAVIDPSEGAAVSSTTGNIPSVLMNSLVNQFGPPAGTFFVQVKTSSSPTGVIQEFSNSIRFGAMKFNLTGSASECNQTGTNIECPPGGPISTPDGGQVISYIKSNCSATTITSCKINSDCPSGESCVSPVGDHATAGTLINTIDSVVAETWTPFAEAFYDAIGYFARTNLYTTSPGTSRTELRINTADFDASQNPSQYKCQANNILIVTDGMATADRNSAVNNLATLYNDGDNQIGWTGCTGTCQQFAGSRNLDDLSWLAKHRNIKTFSTTSASTTTPVELSESITTHVIFTGVSTTDTGESNPATLMSETATNGGGTYQAVTDPSMLKSTLRNTLLAIAAQAASGTAASVLASGEGSGANLIQAMFYTERKQFGTTTIDPGIKWIGSLKNLWYYMDPFFTNSIIMDDSTPDYILNLSNDCSITFTSVAGTVKAIKCGATTIDVENISVLWEAGTILHSRTWSDRKIYVYDGTSVSLLPDTISTGNALISPMQATGATDTIKANEATAIARYVKGNDVKVCSTNKNICTTAAADCTGGETCDAYRSRTVTIGSSNTWKLGDIISSTPKIVSWAPLNGYYKTYNDQSYKTFTESSGYTNRGMVFVGANDGMLHAFYLGKLELSGSWQTDPTVMKAKLSDPSGIGLGKEMWAFIPKNALPYLKYMADPNYCHIYSIDATPYVFDASIYGAPGDTRTSSSWRTILIGGMRLGGACKDTTYTGSNGVIVPTSGNGYSSYFALDITDTLAHPDSPTTYPPQLLWEFSDPTLGFATTGPAVVRIGQGTKNGEWFVVFGSGPTGPIDTGSKQFKGYSDQPLKLFVFDLMQGPGSSNGNVTTITPSLSINNAFVGSLMGAPIDIHQNNPGATGFYQDDALYFGYTQSEDITPTSTTKWTKGGVLRLLTKENTDPSQWALNTVISGIGPVTASVAKLQNYKSGSEALWLYFGTGRYYYKSSNEIDDATDQQILYGIKEPCFSGAVFTVPGYNTFTSCTTTVSEGSLGEAATAAGSSVSVLYPNGWKISLDLCTDSVGTVVGCSDPSMLYTAERVIASPTTSSSGMVFFATAKPSTDLCSYGGGTHLWAVAYNTGGAVSSDLLIGKALIQVSTGSIEQMDLSKAFTSAYGGNKDGRRTAMLSGLAVASPPIVTSPKAVKRTIHMRER